MLWNTWIQLLTIIRPYVCMCAYVFVHEAIGQYIFLLRGVRCMAYRFSYVVYVTHSQHQISITQITLTVFDRCLWFRLCVCNERSKSINSNRSTIRIVGFKFAFCKQLHQHQSIDTKNVFFSFFSPFFYCNSIFVECVCLCRIEFSKTSERRWKVLQINSPTYKMHPFHSMNVSLIYEVVKMAILIVVFISIHKNVCI